MVAHEHIMDAAIDGELQVARHYQRPLHGQARPIWTLSGVPKYAPELAVLLEEPQVKATQEVI